MSKLPPALQYLTIYNPTLRPLDEQASKDDDDAEEQAHILFYTGRERAVSRDRMLRQVGLAKALINFAGMFNAADICESTHSQSRRMIMVSPEPNFWIHACVELAKTPRQPKAKPVMKGKGKESVATQEPLYEYHDGSVNDGALKEHILDGYRHFKLTHGSFASILESLGQVALELQLERFFTVWAWQWDFEDGMDFGRQLGSALHPAYVDALPVIDRFGEQYLPNHVIFVLSPPHLLPSSALFESRYPAALSKLVLQRIPPQPNSPPAEIETHEEKVDKSDAADNNRPTSDEKKPTEASKVLANTLASMDVRNLKWMWSGLTFNKGSLSSKSTPAVTSPLHPPETPPSTQSQEITDKKKLSRTETEVEVDRESLQDAIESDNMHLSARTSPASTSPAPPPADVLSNSFDGQEVDRSGANSSDKHQTETIVVGTEAVREEEHGLAQEDITGQPPDSVKRFVSDVESQDTITTPLTAKPPSECIAPPAFFSAPVFLPEFGADEHSTTRKRVFHATNGSLTFAFVAEEGSNTDLDSLANHVVDFLNDVQDALDAAHERDSQASVLTVTKILEPQDKHIVSAGEYTVTSTGFTSTFEHLFSTRESLRSKMDVLEVFSRGQTPPHWHLGRRGLDIGSYDALAPGEVYMEVARKESTLTDVDNELAGVVNRYTEQ